MELYNHSNKPMRVPDLKKTWISRNFRIQNIDGTLIPTATLEQFLYLHVLNGLYVELFALNRYFKNKLCPRINKFVKNVYRWNL